MLKKKYSRFAGNSENLVLKKLSLSVHEGEVYGFLGNNGSGKTTTIKAILGLIGIDGGTIKLFGVDRDLAPRERIGFAQERTAFYNHLSAMEILNFNGELLGMTAEEIERRAWLLLDRVRLKDRAHDRVHTFSKGMKQRLGLANALLNDPDLVILDEPATGLDPFGRALVAEIILDLKARGKTVFFSSHNLEDVERVCTRFGILVRGELKVEMTPADLARERTSGGGFFKNLEEYFMELHREPDAGEAA